MSDNTNNPWDNRKKDPPDWDKIIQEGLKIFGKKFQSSEGGDKSPKSKPPVFSMGLILTVLLILFLGFQSMYQINPNEQGVVLRFGKFYSISHPGLNFLIPLADKVVKVDVESIRKEEFGVRKSLASAEYEEYSGSRTYSDLESLMITSDKNVIQLNWVVQYKIRDPERYLFRIRNPRETVRDISEAVIRRLVGNRYFDYLLNNRGELASSAEKEMQELLDKYQSGIELVAVQLQDFNPPDPVRPSFNEVNAAEQDKIRLGNEAQKEANTQIPKARGTALKIVEEAEGYAIERINEAKGNTARFNSIYEEYTKARDVTRTRMYIETLKQVLPEVNEIILVDDRQNNVIPLLNLGNVDKLK